MPVVRSWASGEAAEAHESGAAFQRYKEALRLLIDPDSVLFGNCVPVKVLGYPIEPPQRQAPRRGSRNHRGCEKILVVLQQLLNGRLA